MDLQYSGKGNAIGKSANRRLPEVGVVVRADHKGEHEGIWGDKESYPLDRIVGVIYI